MIFNVAGAGARFSVRLAVFVEAVFAKAGVGFLIVACKIEIVLDQRSTHEGVVADAVSAHPGIEHGQGKQKEHEKKKLRFARTWMRRRGQTLRLRKTRYRESPLWKACTQATRRAHRQNSRQK